MGRLLSCFLANGYFDTWTQFKREHCHETYNGKFWKIDGYFNETRLERLRSRILVRIDYKPKTTSHQEVLQCKYDILKYRELMKTRWNIYKDKPIESPMELCVALRRVISEDESRVKVFLELLEQHPKVIVFYNYDFELDILKSIAYEPGTELAEWNGHRHQPIPDAEKWLYLVQYNAGAEGWNCIFTDTIIFFSDNYSYKIMEQARGRIDRANTSFTDLYYYHFRTKAKIDLAVTKALEEKKIFNERRFLGWK